MKAIERPFYGAAYYDEYMPVERLDKDIEMLKAAGMNVVRIAESTWSTCEPQEGVFDFSHVTKVIDAMEKAGMNVIVGTPTYAIPTWMVKSHPEVLAITIKGQGIYGARQIMDITSPVYRFYAERVIRKLMEVTANRKCVIGFQLDNETKYYDTAGPNVQHAFIKYLRKEFNDDLDKMNKIFGLDYWSNRINAWEDFPDIRGTINGSIASEFAKFQRTLVDEFLAWQAKIVSEYKREDQFITHNFDYEWRNYSYGLQPLVNHLHASRCLTISGVDIYHPTQDKLTGSEIAFGGDLNRCLLQENGMNKNYLVIETEAQGFPEWLPYPGQLRLQAYSHFASGANMVMYWHWHSIHNSFETYWKGVLSHDFQPNETYKAASIVGNELNKFGNKIVSLIKKNDVAILVSNESLTALKWFNINSGFPGDYCYNDILRWIYNCLYNLNIEVDFIWPETELEQMGKYKLIVVSALYSTSDSTLTKLNKYVENGGHIFVTFKSGFTNEYVKVSHETQPHILNESLGIAYNHFTVPTNVKLSPLNDPSKDSNEEVEYFMELVEVRGAQILSKYISPNWGQYAAVTRNSYGKGTATYLACKSSTSFLADLLHDVAKTANVLTSKNEYHWPIIVREGTNQFEKSIRYYLNYSSEKKTIVHNGNKSRNLINDAEINPGQNIEIGPWDLAILESI